VLQARQPESGQPVPRRRIVRHADRADHPVRSVRRRPSHRRPDGRERRI